MLYQKGCPELGLIRSYFSCAHLHTKPNIGLLYHWLLLHGLCLWTRYSFSKNIHAFSVQGKKRQGMPLLIGLFICILYNTWIIGNEIVSITFCCLLACSVNTKTIAMGTTLVVHTSRGSRSFHVRFTYPLTLSEIVMPSLAALKVTTETEMSRDFRC